MQRNNSPTSNLSRTQATFSPPVMEARRWLEDITFPNNQPLINVSQAAPIDPPPRILREAITEIALNSRTAHHYGPVLGLPELREELANKWSTDYNGVISSENVAITSGCNQAFCAAITTLANNGDNVILPSPWYFNHIMWLQMQGIKIIEQETNDKLLPNPDETETLIDDNTKAIVITTPNNPAGVEYPKDLISRLYEIAKSHEIALIIDETYRDFLSHNDAPHNLFENADWPDTLIHLYSFSKAYRLTGHRIGAIFCSTKLLSEAEKFLDTMSICPNQIGQQAALWGLRHLQPWLKNECSEILNRRVAIQSAFAELDDPGWKLLGSGAYFAYARHPFNLKSDELARRIVRKAGILLLPGTMFRSESNPQRFEELRIAFANLDCRGISELFKRLNILRDHMGDLVAN
ncbi:MAG: aminotransferase [Aestuariivita sp.]|nr:aminotransferase [Aestuariivita sp.]